MSHTTSPNTGFDSQLAHFFITMLQEAYWSEQHLVKVLETMSESAGNTELKQAFTQHREETQTHIQHLSEVFRLLGEEPRAVTCIGMQGLFNEGWRVIDETETGSPNRDVALIIAAQKVEHYEMASYGSMVTLATTMAQPAIAKLLSKILADEKQADASLTSIAEGKGNKKAEKEKAKPAKKQEAVAESGDTLVKGKKASTKEKPKAATK